MGKIPLPERYLRKDLDDLKPSGLQADYALPAINSLSQYTALHFAPVSLREASTAEIEAWDELVTRFDNYRIFHKRAWMRSIAGFARAKPLYLVFERGGEIAACMPGFLVKVGLLRIYGSPLVGWQTESMGPVFDPNRVSSGELFSALIPYLEKHHRVHHIELAGINIDQEAMMELGFKGERLFTYRVPLYPGDPQRALAGFKRNTRNQLRKAIKLGLTAAIETEEAFVEEFYSQAKEVFEGGGKVIPFSQDRVLQCFRHMRESGNLLAISVRLPDGAIAATGIFMIEGRELSFWGWTHRTQYRWYCPSELLIWTAIEKGAEAGCVTFDMAGGGDAKLKFGAVPDESTYRWVRSRYRWLGRLREQARKVYRWQQALRGGIAQRRTQRDVDAQNPVGTDIQPQAEGAHL
jgi:hypothetical protein